MVSPSRDKGDLRRSPDPDPVATHSATQRRVGGWRWLGYDEGNGSSDRFSGIDTNGTLDYRYTYVGTRARSAYPGVLAGELLTCLGCLFLSRATIIYDAPRVQNPSAARSYC